jgi:hypothetical protein
VVFCKLSKLQLSLYNHFLQSDAVKALLASTVAEDGAGPPRKRKSKAAADAQQAAGDGQQPEVPQEPEPPAEKGPMLAPLPAITGERSGGVCCAGAALCDGSPSLTHCRCCCCLPLVTAALKKLCSHPDLIWQMLHKHSAAAQQQAQQAQRQQMMEAQRRISGRASAQVHAWS